MAKASRPAPAKRARKADAVGRGSAPDNGETAPPGFIEPAIATTVDKVPAGTEWLHEFKWDGYRLMVRVDRGKVQLFTRNGFDWTERFPTIAKAAAALPVTSAYLDGEAVVEERGIPDFTALRRALGEGRGDKAILIAFDLLFLDGEDLRKEPLVARKERLAEILRDVPRPSALVYSEHVAGMADFMMRQAGALGLEGVLSKRADRPYVSGETRDWRKAKRINRQEFVVAGYLMPKGKPQAISSLVLGWYEEGKLVYRGRVGVGFDQRTAGELWWKLQPLRRKDPAFPAGVPAGGAKEAVWIEPKLVAEVAFGHWTPGGLLRHAVFKGLREDKAPEEVVGTPAEAKDPAPQPAPNTPEELKRKPQPKPATTRSVARETKVGVPRENILQLLPDAVVPSKEELAGYWQRVGPAALEHLARRPLKLVFHRHGTTYFHMGPLPPVRPAVHQLKIQKREGGEGTRLWVDNVTGLLGLVEMGAVEVHPWGATVDDIEHPDVLVFDLDPGDDVPWEFVTDTALRLRELLDKEGLASWPKTTGGKGLHLMVPMERRRTADQARVYARSVVQRFARTAPDRYTLAADPDERQGRVFLDYLRNGRGTTAIGAWSPRARPGLPIARPVTWKDVENGIAADAFTMAEPGLEPPKRKRARKR